MQRIMVTGGAGFIGSNFVRYMLQAHPDYTIRYAFVRGDICDIAQVEATVKEYAIDTIVNFAAETHVDRSLMEPGSFIQTDVYGTYVLLETTRKFELERYHQISTDEVYGQVLEGRSKETDPLAPRSPYAASKAGADLMVLAYHESWGVPVTITRGSNNVGPYQYPEKVVPLRRWQANARLPACV